MVQHIERINAIVRHTADAHAMPVFLVDLALLILIAPAYKPRVVGFKAMIVIVHLSSPFYFLSLSIKSGCPLLSLVAMPSASCLMVS